MRYPRKLRDGAVYHVTSEINRNEMDLQQSRIKTMFLTFVNKATQKYPFQLFNFCVMDNHIHLLVKPDREQSLSKIMQWIKGNFARYWNKLHHKQGSHLWGKRFFSQIIDDVRQFLRVFSYIDENPKRAGMVEKAEDWEFGGLYHHLRGRTDVVEIPRRAMLELCFPGKAGMGSDTARLML
ncbi:MAG: transposase [Treponema sp.]|nr:transposase [Treponema sp.]